MRRPSKRPPRKMRVLGVGGWEGLEWENAVRGGRGEGPLFGQGMRWRIPGWVDGDAMIEGEEDEVFWGFIVE